MVMLSFKGLREIFLFWGARVQLELETLLIWKKGRMNSEGETVFSANLLANSIKTGVFFW